jgi:hypothetical protein
VQLNQSDRVPAVRHRHDHPRTLADPAHVRVLGPQHPLVHRTLQLHHLRVPGTPLLLPCRVGPGPPEPSNRPPGQVSGQKADVVGVQHRGELIRQYIDRLDRRRRLDLVEKRTQVRTRYPRPVHLHLPHP